jgi:hypothetical protein
VLGAPFLYSTTPEFLEYLGLDSLKDLPSIEELEALLEREESAMSEPEEGEQTVQQTPDRDDEGDAASLDVEGAGEEPLPDTDGNIAEDEISSTTEPQNRE